jgi:hypothetical protein
MERKLMQLHRVKKIMAMMIIALILVGASYKTQGGSGRSTLSPMLDRATTNAAIMRISAEKGAEQVQSIRDLLSDHKVLGPSFVATLHDKACQEFFKSAERDNVLAFFTLIENAPKLPRPLENVGSPFKEVLLKKARKALHPATGIEPRELYEAMQPNWKYIWWKDSISLAILMTALLEQLEQREREKQARAAESATAAKEVERPNEIPVVTMTEEAPEETVAEGTLDETLEKTFDVNLAPAFIKNDDAGGRIAGLSLTNKTIGRTPKERPLSALKKKELERTASVSALKETFANILEGKVPDVNGAIDWEYLAGNNGVMILDALAVLKDRYPERALELPGDILAKLVNKLKMLVDYGYRGSYTVLRHDLEYFPLVSGARDEITQKWLRETFAFLGEDASLVTIHYLDHGSSDKVARVMQIIKGHNPRVLDRLYGKERFAFFSSIRMLIEYGFKDDFPVLEKALIAYPVMPEAKDHMTHKWLTALFSALEESGRQRTAPGLAVLRSA